MVQKSGPRAALVAEPAPRPRGRPRAYDPDTALARALDLFWDKGYASVSLDELAAHMGMNKPSLYAAFGDKRALYNLALTQYRDAVRAQTAQTLSAKSLREALARYYANAIDVYLSKDKGARGCFVVSTALAEATHDPEIRSRIAAGIRHVDETLEARIALGKAKGETARDADPAELGKLATATLYSIAIRARAGASRKDLQAAADAVIKAICQKT